MDARNHMAKPVWDRSLPNSIALIKYLQHCARYAQQLTGHATQGGHGLKHRLFSAAEFLQRYGVAPEVIQRPEDLAANATAVDIENSKRLWDAYNLQQSMDGILEAAVEGGYPEYIRAMLEIDFSLDHLTLQEQLTQLRASLPTTAADIIWLRAEVSKPWAREEKIETCTAKQIQHLGFLTTIGQAPAPLESIQIMWSAFTSTAQDKSDFASCMVRFRDQRPALADQTPANFAVAVVAYVNNLLPAEREANVARKQANVATEIVAAPNVAEPELIAFMALMAKDAPAAVAYLKGRSATPAAAAAAAPAAAAPAAAAKTKYYCHTCGVPRNPALRHHSKQCKNKVPGHRDDATFSNQLGGKPA